MPIHKWINTIWYKHTPLYAYLLLPFTLLYQLSVYLRRQAYKYGLFQITQLDVPVFVVGNLSVGGTGKTPLLIALCEHFTARGISVGVVSRGYGAKPPSYPFHVTSTSKASDAGDEPLLVAQRTRAPVFIDPCRPRAAKALLLAFPDTDVIISDDGLQHYALHRDVEIAVVDSTRGVGNGFCLPLGPLREPVSRLTDIDFQVFSQMESTVLLALEAPQQQLMQLQIGECYCLADPRQTQSLTTLSGSSVAAITGIGDPDRFFRMLRRFDIDVDAHAFADHHVFIEADFLTINSDMIFTTEKDAVKCHDLAIDKQRVWVVQLSATLSDTLYQALHEHLPTRQ